MKGKLNSVINTPITGSQIYFLAFVLFFVPTFLLDTTFSSYIGEHIMRVCSYMALPLLFFKIFIIDNWKKWQTFVVLLCLFIGIIDWRTAHNLELLMLVPFIVGAKEVNFKNIIEWYFYLSVIFLGLIAVFAIIGIIPNLIYHYTGRPTRFSVGTIFPSIIAAHYLYIALAYCYLRFNKLKYMDYCGIIAGGLVCMYLTNTRLDFVGVVLSVPVMIIAQRAFRQKTISKMIASFYWMASPVIAVLTIFGSFFYDDNNHIMRKINDLVSGRLSLGHEAFSRYNVKLFGRTIVEHSYTGIKGHKLADSVGAGMGGTHYFYIDSSYIRMILLWGLVAFLGIMIIVTYITLRSIINNTYVLAAIYLIASLNFMFEPHIIQIVYNPFILALVARSDFVSKQEGTLNASE